MVNRVDRAVDQGVVNHHKMPISYDLIHCDKHRDLKATMYVGFFVVVVFFQGLWIILRRKDVLESVFAAF